eukprot:Hpha_TRINITY_DN23349_c0_g1::TRINITY_DN23349_c0_g1_i1::g.96899::m.96899/K00109/L2HGDH; 2-hydroxyglutarate dehydrogenase
MFRFCRRLGFVAVASGGGWWVVTHPEKMPWAPRPLPLSDVPSALLPERRVNSGSYDVVVVGGGIVGLATAAEALRRHPGLRLAVVEKEGEVAGHQTGHNSGVIHAGMYYMPGSVMAKACVDGARFMYDYAEKKGIPHERVGKLICAPTAAEHEKVEELYRKGTANGVEGLRVLYRDEIRKLEPNVDVYSALDSPNTGIIDFGDVARQLQRDLVSLGVDFHFRFQVSRVTESPNGVKIEGVEPRQDGPLKVIEARNLITCAGLHMDRVAQLAGGEEFPRVVTFRGRYYQMKPQFRNIVKRNVYPVPSEGGIPVGVHFTPTVGGLRGQNMIVGPGACITFHPEGYRFSDFSLSHMWHICTNTGFWNFAINNVSLSLGELWKDVNQAVFLAEAKKLVPGVTADMVEDSFVGVMAQVFMPDGKPAADYVFERKCLGGTTLHLRNAPSPAATSSFAIAREVIDRAEEDFSWRTTAA